MLKRDVGKNLRRIMALIAIPLGVIFFYAVIHEGGHALFVLLFGGEVTSFQVNFLIGSPRVSYMGITDPMHRAIISLAGPLFPLLFMIPLTYFLGKTKHVFVQGTLLLSLFSILPTLLTSTIIALVTSFGITLANEDVAKFILYSGIHPLIVTVSFLLLFVVSLMYVLKVGNAKKIFLGVVQELRGTADSTATMRSAKILVLIFLIVWGGSFFLTKQFRETLSEPSSYQAKIELNFDALKGNSPEFHHFTVETPTIYDFTYSLRTNEEVALRLVNRNGILPFNNQESIVMYHGNENIQQAYFTGFTLLEGDYTLELLTAGNGSLTMYITTRVPSAIDQQYLNLLTAINEGTFTGESYQEEGYQLVYEGELLEAKDELLLTLPGTTAGRQVSAFVVGDVERFSLSYIADGQNITFLKDFKATMGYGLPAHRGPGEFHVTAEQPTAKKLYIYVYLEGEILL